MRNKDMEKGNEVKTVVPALRFPEFREMEGWRGEKLISLCDIINGKCNLKIILRVVNTLYLIVPQ